MAEDILVIPPIRQSLEDINSATANGISQPLTEKSWYLYWQRLGERVNALQGGGGGTPSGGISTQNQPQPPPFFGHVYQNVNATPLFVLVSCRLYYADTYSEVAAFTDADSFPVTEVSKAANHGPASQILIPLMFIVLPNNYYKVELMNGAANLEIWTEWF